MIGPGAAGDGFAGMNFTDSPPWLWPMAATMQAGAAMLGAFGGNSAGGPSAKRMEEPIWTTPHRVVLDTAVMRVRLFGDGNEPSAVIVTPYSMHGAAVADIAPGFSLVERLLGCGLDSLALVEWKSATPQMRYLGIDDYLLHLSAVLEDIERPVTLIGLCQGGWLSLLLSARFPRKVSRLVLVGAPVDIDAAPSKIADGARLAIPEITRLMVESNGGIVPGRSLGPLLNGYELERSAVSAVLQVEAVPQDTVERFERWYASTLDLPGAYFLQVVEEIFGRNTLALGRFRSLGRLIDLSQVRNPLFVIASEEDEVVPLHQALAVRTLLGTPPDQIVTGLGRGGHLSLFMGTRNLDRVWRDAASWIRQPR